MKEENFELYDKKGMYRRALALLNGKQDGGRKPVWNISIENRHLINDFLRFNITGGKKIGTALKHLYNLKIVSEKMLIDFPNANKADIEDFINWLEQSDYSPGTKRDVKISIKVFYKWLEATRLGISVDELVLQGKEPQQTRWIKAVVKRSDKKLPEQLLTEEDALALINSCLNPRDKCLVSVLFESGARIGEVGMLRIKDIVFDQNGAKIILVGKTGPRKIRLVASAKHLADWVNQHPNKNDAEALLWVGPRENQPLRYNGLKKIIAQAAKRAGIKKPINPHHFRHSRATLLARNLSDQILKDYLGWAPNSGMASVYVHLSGKQTDDAILGLYGLKEKSSDSKEELMPQKCPGCGKVNEPTAIYCAKCRIPLSIGVAVQQDQAQLLAQKVLETKLALLEAKIDLLTKK